MYLIMTPHVSHVRVYNSPQGYVNKEPYKAIFTISHLTDKLVFISATIGVIDKEIYTKLSALLYAKGYRKVLFERRGRIVERKTSPLLVNSIKFIEDYVQVAEWV